MEKARCLAGLAAMLVAGWACAADLSPEHRAAAIRADVERKERFAYPPGAVCAEDDLQKALHTAFGGDVVRHVVQPQHPSGAAKGDSLGPPQPVDLTLEPARLVPIGAGRYALVVLETNQLGSHAAPGAIGVAYLRRGGSGWLLDRAWPEFIWTGNAGRAADSTNVLTYSGRPMIVASSDYLGQGQHSATAWFIRLGERTPEYLGQAPLSGSLPPDACDACRHYDYEGFVQPPRVRGDAFSVAYTGRQQTEGGDWVKFSAWTDYRSHDGELVATRKVALPGS
ncbi:MAG TPA: hypothetical protein VFW13_06725 [Phenylobacterium sp.]|nr:hypothetical protein [Phenylobacterium sp.]